MQKLLLENKAFILNLWDRIEQKVSVTAQRVKDGMPYTTVDGVYDDWQDRTDWWTNSFWPGILWHLYRETGEDGCKQYAQSVEAKLDAALYAYEGLHHDVGFMWLLSSVMNYETTADERARQRAMLAASVLASRYNMAGGYIRAWNSYKTGWAIIDCMMNIPLLFWASEQSKDDRFKHVGIKHADKTMKDFVREDGSVNHIVIYNEQNGEVLETPAGQGYASGSSWSRGQGWAIYGFAQAYNWTHKPEYLHTAKRVAHYTLSCLALNDYVPLCDYRQPVESKLLDSSAGAITACGLIEIAKAVPSGEQTLYLQGALSILKALDERCALWDRADEALLTHATTSYDLATGIPGAVVGNGALIYGDYYFVEAIVKLKSLL